MPHHGYKSRHGAFFYSEQRKEERRKDAERRNSHWQSLSLAEQLAELDKRFGEGCGAQKQRAKISKWIAEGHTHAPAQEKKHGHKPKPKKAVKPSFEKKKKKPNKT